MNKLVVLYDDKGNILSAGRSEGGKAPKGAPAPGFGVMAGKGQKVGELEVPAEHQKLELHELVTKLHVQVRGKEPYLALKKS